jgi:predicted RNA-binding Zn-ribbon protein involved in translation (DUF1610 family)
MTTYENGGATQATKINQDERPQLKRLQTEKGKVRGYLICHIHGMVLIFVITIHGWSRGWRYEDLVHVLIPFTLFSLIGIIMLSFRYDWKTRSFTWMMFTCPNCKGRTPAIIWQCSNCEHVHKPLLMYGNNLPFLYPFWKILGEKCSDCKTASSDFYCPHCNKKILLDTTVPKTKPAYVPGWVPPKGLLEEDERQVGPPPLMGFPEQTLD